MNNLSQIFGKTLAPTPSGRRSNSPSEETAPDPMLEAFMPTDQVDLRSSGGPAFQPSKFANMASLANNSSSGLPSLSRSYGSHGGGLLDIVG